MLQSELLKLMHSRDLISQINHEDELDEMLAKGVFDEKGRRYAVYAGFDPTAKSLHIGHACVLTLLRRCQDVGLTPIILLGGATGLIGDPTDKTDMRPMLSREDAQENVERFKKQVQRYFRDDAPNPPLYVDNLDWFGDMKWLDFARNIGVHFTVARLLAADVNRTRMEAGGLTFMELSYQLLQSYDFLHLNTHYNCILQVGGNDQWSNVLGGADLIRRVAQRKAFAVTTQLLVDSQGRKLGKTAGNAVWIDPEMLSSYDLFQYFRNLDDSCISQMLRTLTFESLENIAALTSSQANINASKEHMAFEVVKWIHGEEAAIKARDTARAFFSGQGGDLSNAPRSSVSTDELTSGLDVLGALVKAGLCASRGEARKLVEGGGVTFNGQKCTDSKYKIAAQDFETEHGALVLRKGKKDYHLLVLNS